MTRSVWYRWIAGCLFLVLALTLVCLSAEFCFRSPRNPEARIVMRGEFAVAARDGWMNDEQGARIPVPVIRVGQKQYDFGWSNPNQKLRFSLPIQNAGRADLRFSVTSDRLTPEPAELVLPPGKSTIVEFAWETGQAIIFQETATIHTNDTVKPEITFEVSGQVRQFAAAMPPVLQTEPVDPEKSGPARTFVYSHLWPAMEVLKCDVSDPAIQVQTQACKELTNTNSDQTVSSGVWVSVDVPGRHSPGIREATVTLEVRSSEGGDSRIVEIPVRAPTMRRLCTYGEGIDESGEIDLGIINPFVGKSVSFLVKIRDQQRQLPITQIMAEPEFVQVSLKPVPGGEAKGHYRLTVTVPENSPECNCLINDQRGSIIIRSAHPRVPEQRYLLRFAVQKEA